MTNKKLRINFLENDDIPFVTDLARKEGFAPGIGDLTIYSHTDRQGLWVARLEDDPIGCIAGVRYNSLYGFIGLFLVIEEKRGKGYGLELWKKALNHLEDLSCVGLEAAPNRLNDYSKWGFSCSSKTTRWQWVGSDCLDGEISIIDNFSDINVLQGTSIPSKVVQTYDAKRETSSRPHFLSDWLKHPAGNVYALVDNNSNCKGFGRIRPCLLKSGKGWRVVPLIADTPALAEFLLRKLVEYHPGIVLLDSPGLNNFSNNLLTKLGFKEYSHTFRMYKGIKPEAQMNEVYALACLELG